MKFHAPRKNAGIALVVVMIAITDVIFAVDSIPAIFAITLDPFIVLTSNVFAVLGLRALYFMLADLADRFHLLKYGIAFILIFIGIKMLLIDLEQGRIIGDDEIKAGTVTVKNLRAQTQETYDQAAAGAAILEVLKHRG